MSKKMSKRTILFLLVLVLFITLACESPLARPISSAPAEDKTFTYQGKGTHTWSYNKGEQTCPTEDDMTLTINAGIVILRSEGKCMYIQGIQNYTCYELHPGDRCGITLTGRYEMSSDQITFSTCVPSRTATGTAKMENGLMTGEVRCEDAESFKFALPELK